MNNNYALDTIPKIRKQAEEVLEQIATCLSRPTAMNYPALLKGNGALALFFAYYHLFTGNEQYGEQSLSILEQCIADMGKTDQAYGLGNGFTGVAWLVKHFINLDILTSDSNLTLHAIEPYIEAIALQQIKQADFDLIYGAIGTGIYYLETEPVAHKTLLQNLCKRILETAVETGQGKITWLDPSAKGKPEINFGLAHGIPSIISFLVRTYETGILPPATLTKIEAAVQWLLEQEMQNTPCMYPASITWEKDTALRRPARLAWCYGDAGIALTLYRAARLLQNDSLHSKAKEIALYATTRKIDTAGLSYYKSGQYYDPCFCHGCSGIMYQLHKLAALTNEEISKNAATTWMQHTLNATTGLLKNFSRIKKKKVVNHETIMISHTGILDGLAGIGLALMGTLDNNCTGWDRILLLHD